jgi:formiminotetrahydrofolate cyclodeaminase
VERLLGDLAAKTAAPGGGSAAAWTGALAAALLEMAAAYARDDEATHRAAELRAELTRQAEIELHAYEPVLAARRDHDQERVRAALERASESPMNIARAATEVAERASRVTTETKPALRGDAFAAVLLAQAAARAALTLVEINLGGPTPETRRLAARAAATTG